MGAIEGNGSLIANAHALLGNAHENSSESSVGILIVIHGNAVFTGRDLVEIALRDPVVYGSTGCLDRFR
jgi:hypothetical protein